MVGERRECTASRTRSYLVGGVQAIKMMNRGANNAAPKKDMARKLELEGVLHKRAI